MNFGLYIHWPFCIKKCPYCDFNTYTFEHDQENWINGILLELEQYHFYFPNYKVDTIFFGGGTPSLINPRYIKQILTKVFELWQKQNDYIEITLETNPSSVETHHLKDFMDNGINRFSIGIQSLNNDTLKFLGRLHSKEEAVKVLKYASSICDNVSADFMYALPFETLYTWKKSLKEITALIKEIDLKHVSLYQLIIEENTPFAKAIVNNEWQPLTDTLQNILYRHTHKIFNQMGWNFYEISNIAKNEQYFGKHNLKYWNYENYLGIGPGAHSRMTYDNKKYKFNNCKAPFKWLKSTDCIQNATHFEQHAMQQIEGLECLSAKDLFIEEFMLICRLNKPVNIKYFKNEYIDYQKLEILNQKNFITIQDDSIKFHLKGKLLLNSILKFLII